MIKIVALLSTLFINLYGAIFMFSTASKKFKNRFYLGVFFFNSFILFVGHFLSFNEYWALFRYFDWLFLTSLLAFYPFYYLYIKSAFNFNIVSTKWIHHFIPSIIVGLLMLVATSLSSIEDYNIYMNNNLYGTPIKSKAALNMAFLYKGSRFFHLGQIIFYNILTIRFLFRANNKMNNFFSNLGKYQLQNFLTVTIAFILLMSIPGFYVTVIGRTPLNDNSMLLFYVCSLFTLLYLILAIIGLKQEPVELKIEAELKKNNNIGQSEIIDVEEKLLDYFQLQKPWLNPNLNILDVSKQIGTNRSYVSKVINERIGCNFNQFVNTYRVNEAKILLLKTPELPISEISDMAGFGSVNSFIRIFKSLEYKTPTNYRKVNA